MNAYEALLARLPANGPVGKSNIVRVVLAAGTTLQDTTRAIGKRDDLSAKGRAGLHANTLKEAGAKLMKARRQLRYHAEQIEKRREAVKAKAIGEAKATDAEYRTYLRSLPTGERTKLALENASARGAALREPGLSGLSADVVDKLMAAAIQDN